MSLTTIRLPDHLVRQLDDAAAQRRTTRSELVREAVETYCKTLRDDEDADPVALVERLVDYTGSGAGDLGRRSEHYLRERLGGRHRRTR